MMQFMHHLLPDMHGAYPTLQAGGAVHIVGDTNRANKAGKAVASGTPASKTLDNGPTSWRSVVFLQGICAQSLDCGRRCRRRVLLAAL